MSVSKRDDLKHTYGDYLVWSRPYGDELIDGAAYVREPPSPAYSHQAFAFEIARQLENQLDGTPWRVIMSPMDVRLPKSTEPDDEIDTVVQPDVIITRDKSKIDTRGVRGAPDWLAEVLSSGTASYDRAVKIPMYQRARVPEVWLVDPKRGTVAIYRLENAQYGPPTIQKLSGRTRLTVVPDVSVDWERVNAKALNED